MARRTLPRVAALALTAALSAASTAAPPAYADHAAPQTSDGVVGKPASPLTRLRAPVVTAESAFTVAPGVEYRQWDQVDARGPLRAFLLTVDPAVAGVSVDYTAAGPVRSRSVVRRMVRREGAVAGVNGDFFDIHDTGAPLGAGRDRERGLLHARASDWTRAFWISRRGVPQVGERRLLARLVQRPHWRIGHLNSPTVWRDSIGIYTPAWGRTAGYRVVDGRRRPVREVVVRHGRVVANRARLSHGTDIRGLLLVGRGDGARRLARLRLGSRLRVQWRLEGRPPVAIGGSEVLLADGVSQVTDDVELHPRTAIGIDRDTGQLLLLVVDGRQEVSRGLTLVELAGLLASLGAEDALNLDGGGSSTLVARDPDGVLRVLNTPSDGAPRPVANGLAVFAAQ